jgi:hypothetical protein
LRSTEAFGNRAVAVQQKSVGSNVATTFSVNETWERMTALAPGVPSDEGMFACERLDPTNVHRRGQWHPAIDPQL